MNVSFSFNIWVIKMYNTFGLKRGKFFFDKLIDTLNFGTG